MTIELSKEQRKEAVASIQQYSEHNMSEPLGELAAGLLLYLLVHEIGPLVYNKAVADAQRRVQLHTGELDSELYQAPFTYWMNSGKRNR